MMNLRSRSFALPFLLLLFFTVILTWPTAITLSTHVVDRQDPLLNAWIMAWEARQLLIAPLELYQTNVFYPLRNTLAFSEILLSTSALVMPIQWAFDHALISYNLAFLLSFFTTALGAYLLALYLTGHRGAALVAGVAFAWSPYRMSHLSQLQLLAFGWLPLALIYLDRLLRGQSLALRQAQGHSISNNHNNSQWLKDTLLFALFFLLQALASFYSALFSTLACICYVVGWLIWQRTLPLRAIAGGMLAALLVALIMVPLAIPYFEIQQTLGAGWTLEQNEQFSASLQAYLYAPEGTLLWGPLTRPFHYIYGACCPPDTLFPGLTLLFLSVVALYRSRSSSPKPPRTTKVVTTKQKDNLNIYSPRSLSLTRTRIWLLIAFTGFLLSLGPTLTVKALEPTGIALPYRWLWDHIPGFNAIRAPVRWVVLVSLALSMLSAIGIAQLRRNWVAPLALLLLLLEFAIFPLPLVTAPTAPASLAWLDEQSPTRILELPLAAERPRLDVGSDQPRRAWEESRLLEMQYFSTAHWHTTPDGYSGYIPARHGDFVREISAFPAKRAITFLQGLSVQYVVIHEDDLNTTRLEQYQQALPEGVQEIARFDDERILSLPPYNHPGLPNATLPIAQLPAQQDITYPLLLTSPNGAYVPLQGEPLNIQVTWEDTNGSTYNTSTSVPWPMIIEEVAVLPLSLTTPSAGEWTLTLSGTYPEGRNFHLQQPIQMADTHPAPPTLLPVSLHATNTEDLNSLTLTWQTSQPLTRYYSISVRLFDQQNNLIAQQDGPPGGDIPTIAWQPSTTYQATWHFDNLNGQNIDDYRLIVLWYDPEGSAPVHIWNGKAFVGEVEVK